MDEMTELELYKSWYDSSYRFRDGLLQHIERLQNELTKLRKTKDRDGMLGDGTGEFKGTDIREKATGEALWFSPSYHHHGEVDNVIEQSIIVAPTHGLVSFASLQTHDKTQQGYTHFWFTREEVAILIQGLAEALAMIERGEE